MYLTQFYCLGHLCAKNYQSWWKFDEVLTKTILAVFLRHGVYIIIRQKLDLRLTEAEPNCIFINQNVDSLQQLLRFTRQTKLGRP